MIGYFETVFNSGKRTLMVTLNSQLFRVYSIYKTVLGIRIWIRRISMFLGLLDPDPDPLVRGMYPDPDPDPNPSFFS
jgi:hypothetical protein